MTPEAVHEYLRQRCTEEGDCLLWSGATNSSGHPVASVDGERSRSLRRWIWQCMRPGVVIGRRRAMSSCDHPLCVQPDHVIALMPSEVMRRAGARGAMRTPAFRRACQLRGRMSSSLTLVDVRAIRGRRVAGETLKAIAADYRIHLSTVHRICRGESWPDPANPFAGLMA